MRDRQESPKHLGNSHHALLQFQELPCALHRPFGLLLSLGLLFLASCASSGPIAPAPAGITYKKDAHLQNVWLADGFDFTGYDVLYLAETSSAVQPGNAEEARLLDWARSYLRAQLATAIGAKGLFGHVVTNASSIPPGSRTLRLENRIVAYSKGSGAARFWAGEFGAGQPLIRVQGRMLDEDTLRFAFESMRSGDSARARFDPGWTGPEKLQELDIRDIVTDLADYLEQTSKHQARK